MNKLTRGLTVHVNYGDLITTSTDNAYDPNYYMKCKLCGGVSDKGIKNRGIHHIGDCVVGRWELRKVIREHKRHTYSGYAGGYHFSVWPNCRDEKRVEQERRRNAGLPSLQWKDTRISHTFN